MTYANRPQESAEQQSDQLRVKLDSEGIVDNRTAAHKTMQLQSLMAASPAQVKLGAAAQLMADKKINNSITPLQRIKIIGKPQYASRPQQRSGSASINLRLDGTLDPDNDPVGKDSLTLVAEDMQPMMKGRKGVLTAMHLINAHLGGSGVEVGNLAWGSQGHNSAHLSEIEKAAKEEAEDADNVGNTMEYKTIPEYCSNIAGDPSFYFLNKVTSSYKVKDSHNMVIAEDSKTVGSDGVAEVQDNEYVEKIRASLPPRPVSTRVRSQSRRAIDSAQSEGMVLEMPDDAYEKQRREKEIWRADQKEKKKREKRVKKSKTKNLSGRISKTSSDEKSKKGNRHKKK
ncbi:hypothetical protein [Cellvibrio sp. OA-2007]|uniref:hypothetical protein n=1 Tax=Cellvibrio sp. OA-2007 TaxID=529823 RepID=UPI0007812449|nr:hypothetical protein [Cellvibrio sp. OA-2007]